MLGTSEDRQTSEPTKSERAPGPAASSLAQEEAEWTMGEASPEPCSTQGALAPKVPCAEACLGGDMGSGLRPRVEVQRWGHTVPFQRIRACFLDFFVTSSSLIYFSFGSHSPQPPHRA